jgi:hypothetical protein
MNFDRFMFAFAGSMVLLSLGLGYFVHEYWFLLTAFVGLNMIQASVTRFCPLVFLLKKMGIKEGVLFK